MLMIKNNSAILIILIAGLFWSFGPLVVRYIDDAHLIPWQYLFFRGSIIFLVLNIYLFLSEGIKFISNYNRIGLSGLIGGVSLGIANITFILSITTTTAAVTMMMLATQPFVAAILAYVFLKEKISLTTLIAIIIAAAGIIFMSFDSKGEGTLFGLLNGLLSSLGFAGFTVSLRWRKKTPKFTTVSIAGIFCAIVAVLVLILNDSNIFISVKNSSLSALHGFLVCTGLILYSAKSKYLPATDLTLLSLTEVLGGIFWVWLPIFGINEVPSVNTLIGGAIITSAIIFYGVNTKRLLLSRYV
ncbi:MAG: DMT family transporter [Candidatus Pelagibacter sp. TMED253]|nr:MAG: DMT family transporter [Candidatus Pelagibacter sp. TMED253]